MHRLLVVGSWLTIGSALLVASQAPASSTQVEVRGSARVGGEARGDVVVWLDAPAASRSAQTAVLDQRNLTFYPRVLAVTVGSTIEFPNNDRVLHNVFSFHDGQRFDLGLYPVGITRTLVFDTPGVSLVFCNIHPKMAAYIVVVESVYHAVSDKDGMFAIDDVPPGTYTYHAWRAGESEISGEVTVEAGARLEVEWP